MVVTKDEKERYIFCSFVPEFKSPNLICLVYLRRFTYIYIGIFSHRMGKVKVASGGSMGKLQGCCWDIAAKINMGYACCPLHYLT